jgi:chondroitin AC lyase
MVARSSYMLALALLAGASQAQTPREDLATIKTRMADLALRTAAPADVARGYLETQAEDGSWPDIDYASQSMATWPANGHVARLWAMAAAYRSTDSALHGDAALLAATLRGWDYWRAHDYLSPNWWHNRIGVPRMVYRMMLLLEAEMSPEQWADGVRVLERGELGLTGQNLMWVAEVTAARGCLVADASVTAEAFRRIAAETRLSEKEGIQADGCFRQHGLLLYSGGYGRGFASDCASFARLAHGTAFAFPPAAIDNLSLYLLDGEQWIVRGTQIDYSTSGRELVRRGYGNASGMLAACEDMIAIDPPRRAEYEAWAERLRSDPTAPTPALVGNRHFWRGDLMSHHRAAYYTSVRVTSDRLRQTEVVNDENLLGQHLADGVSYLYLTGAEYRDIFPVWDWQRLPGTTCEQTGDMSVQNGKPGERPFAGGVSDGTYGLAAMDFARGALTARKSWFLFDDAYVCLGAGITCTSDRPVITTLNQCLLTGEVRCGTEAGPLAPGSRTLAGETWVHHGGVGYVLPEPADLELANQPVVGSWLRIAPVPPGEVTADVFCLSLNHGVGVRDGRYAYTVVPGATAEQTAQFAVNPTVEVLANTPGLQACRSLASGVTGIAAYEAGAIDLPGLPHLVLSHPCLLLWRKDGDEALVTVSNPTNHPATVEVRVGEAVLRYDLPGGMLAGNSVTRRFARG